MKYLVGTLHFLLWIVLALSHCPDGWIGHGRSCYFFSRDKFSMPVSNSVCKRMGGYLVQINTAHENSYLRGQTTVRGCAYSWIGANDIQEEHIWRWYGTDQKTRYTYWNPGEPNTPSYNCAYIYYSTGKWYDAPCYNNYNFICERKKRSLTLDTLGWKQIAEEDGNNA